MLSRIFGNKIHDYLHVLGLSGVAFGVPFNKVVMSVSMMFIVLNLILEANFKSYWDNLISNKFYRLILAFLLLHLLGLFWTDNFEYALHDLRVKLPLLVIPTIVVAKPIIKRHELSLIIAAFTLSTLMVSVLNFSMYQHWISDIQYTDIRGMSRFSSHVRFALTVSMAVACLAYFFQFYKKFRLGLVLLMIWFIYYTIFSQVIAGLSTLLGVGVCLLFAMLWERRKILAISSLSIIVLCVVFSAIWILKPITINQADYQNLPQKTKLGNDYKHYLNLVSPETKKPLYIYICEKELNEEWSNYSSVSIDGKDAKGQPIRQTLIRFLASKDLPKDAEGLSKLSVKEIKSIEKGNASCHSTGVFARIYGLKYQLNNETNPNGHSLLERIEYWNAGWNIFTANLLIGVGTGDVQDEFNAFYSKTNSPLTLENRHRTHNQYLTIGLSFGIFGLLLFVLLNYKFILLNYQNKEILAVLFISILLISFVMEDTIETQTGITFYALFLALFSHKIERSEPE